jgi:hypothetical protein
VSWRWEGWATTEVQQGMVEEGWEPEAASPTFEDAIDHADWLARSTGCPASVVRDPEWEEPWQVWVR